MKVLLEILIASWQLLREVSPYLLLGFGFAGIIYAFVGTEKIKRHLGGKGFAPLLKAVIFGIPLPVCSCGVIPLAASLRKEGASKASTLAFLVSTPTTGVDSILATYAFLGLLFAIFRPAAALFGGLLVGALVWLFDREKARAPEPVHSSHRGLSLSFRLKQALRYGFETLPEDIGKWLIVGVLAGGLITALVPENFLRSSLSNPLLAYPLMLGISIPLYVCATGSIPIAASLLWKGLPPGAALAFLIAGPATNTITITFVLKKLGKKTLLLYLSSIIAIATVSGLLLDLLWEKLGQNPELITGGGRHIPGWFQSLAALLLLILIARASFFRKEESMEHISFLVPDMTCKHCKMTVENALMGVEGVERVVVDLESKAVKVEGDASFEKLKKAVEEAGYRVVKPE